MQSVSRMWHKLRRLLLVPTPWILVYTYGMDIDAWKHNRYVAFVELQAWKWMKEKKKKRLLITDAHNNRNFLPLYFLHITFEIPYWFQPLKLNILLLAAECISHWGKCILQPYFIINNMAIWGPSEDAETCYWKHGSGPTESAPRESLLQWRLRTHLQSPNQISLLTSSPDTPPMTIKTSDIFY